MIYIALGALAAVAVRLLLTRVAAPRVTVQWVAHRCDCVGSCMVNYVPACGDDCTVNVPPWA
jgi:hypothetical protein